MAMPVKGVPPTQVFILGPIAAEASPRAELKPYWFLFHFSMTEISSPSIVMATTTCTVRLRHIILEKGQMSRDVAMVMLDKSLGRIVCNICEKI
jgi:hypothetical protein